VLGVVISRDGKYLAYSDDTGISLKIIDTGEIRLLPETKGLVAMDWFPQADKLLALRDYKELWAISILGGPARKLYDYVSGGYVASVSPDGSQIAFLTQGVPSREIWMIGSNGEEPHRVVVADEFDGFMDFSWAPGGKRFAYIRRHKDPDKAHLFLETRDLTGNSPTLIFSDPKAHGYRRNCSLLACRPADYLWPLCFVTWSRPAHTDQSMGYPDRSSDRKGLGKREEDRRSTWY
jgi:Tol biopolymer transport system component